VLLDTNAAVWLTAREPMDGRALSAIAAAQSVGCLHVSPISAWEVSLALQKAPVRRPNLRDLTAEDWFRALLGIPGVVCTAINERIALEAAGVPGVFGRGDPGDCFIIATARVLGVPVVSRDGPMADLAAARPDFIRMIPC